MDRARLTTSGTPAPAPAREVAVEAGGDVMVLRGDRTLYWPRRNWLILADLHVGKVESLRRDGVALPDAVLLADLARLTHAVRATGAERVLVLGDLVHDAHGLTPGVVARVAEWREALAVDVALVPGNHDRRVASLPDAWRIRVLDEQVCEGAYAFVHDARSGSLARGAGRFTWQGHVHPVVALRGATDALRLPCFLVGDGLGVVPAFSTLTGGAALERTPGGRVWVVADGELVALPCR